MAFPSINCIDAGFEFTIVFRIYKDTKYVDCINSITK